MNIITCNIRGLRRPAKWFLVMDFLNMHFVEVCYIQELKLEEITISTWREIGGSHLDQFAYVPTRGSAGGIIMGWNSVLLNGKIEKVGEFSLTVEFSSKKDNFKWHFLTMYGPIARAFKQAFNFPWIVCDDFNAIFSL